MGSASSLLTEPIPIDVDPHVASLISGAWARFLRAGPSLLCFLSKDLPGVPSSVVHLLLTASRGELRNEPLTRSDFSVLLGILIAEGGAPRALLLWRALLVLARPAGEGGACRVAAAAERLLLAVHRGLPGWRGAAGEARAVEAAASAPLAGEAAAFVCWAAGALEAGAPLSPEATHPLLYWLASTRLSLLRAAGEQGILCGAPALGGCGGAPLPAPQARALARAYKHLRAASPSGLLDAAALAGALCPTLPPCFAALVFSAAAGGAGAVPSAEALRDALAPLLACEEDAAWAALVAAAGRGGAAAAAAAVHEAAVAHAAAVAGAPFCRAAAAAEALPPPPLPPQQQAAAESSSEAAPAALRTAGAAPRPPAEELRAALCALRAAVHIDLGIPPPRGEEAGILASVARAPSHLDFFSADAAAARREGDVWCLVPAGWYAAWACGGAAAPGRIPTAAALAAAPAPAAPPLSPLPPLRDGVTVGLGDGCAVPVCPRVWRALAAWYGVDGPALPRAVVAASGGDALQLELYPLPLLLLRESGRGGSGGGGGAATTSFFVIPAHKHLPPAAALAMLLGPFALPAAVSALAPAASASAAAAPGVKPQRLLLVSRSTPAEALRSALSDALCPPGGALRLWRLARAGEVAAAAATAAGAVGVGGDDGGGCGGYRRSPAENPHWPFLPLCGPGGGGAHGVWAWPAAAVAGSSSCPWESRWCPPAAAPPLGAASPPPLRVAVEMRGALRGAWEASRWHAAPLACAPPPGAPAYAPVGLSNPSTLCYLNAGLQCLLALPLLPLYFSSGAYLADVVGSGGGGGRAAPTTACAMAAFTRAVRAAPRGSAPVSPARLHKAVERLLCGGAAAAAAAPLEGGSSSGSATWEQHDAEEALSALLGALGAELNREGGRPAEAAPCVGAGAPDAERAAAADAAAAASDRSLVSELFRFQLRSELTCGRCGAARATFDCAALLPLPLPQRETGAVCVALAPRFGDAGGAPTAFALQLPFSATIGDAKDALLSAAGAAGGRDTPLRREELTLLPMKGPFPSAGGGAGPLFTDAAPLASLLPAGDFSPSAPPPPATGALAPLLLAFPVAPLPAATPGAPPPPPFAPGAPVFARWGGSMYPAHVARVHEDGALDVDFEDGDAAAGLRRGDVEPRVPTPAPVFFYHTGVALAGSGALLPPRAPPPPGAPAHAFSPHPLLSQPALSSPHWAFSPLVAAPLAAPPFFARLNLHKTTLAALYVLVYRSASRWVRAPPPASAGDDGVSPAEAAARALPACARQALGAATADSVAAAWGFVLRMGKRGGVETGSAEPGCVICPWFQRCRGCLLPPDPDVTLSRVQGLRPWAAAIPAGAPECGQADAAAWVNVNVEWADPEETWDRRAAARCEAGAGGGGSGEAGAPAGAALEDCLRLFSSPQAVEGVRCASCGHGGLPAPSAAPPPFAAPPLAVPLAEFLSAEAGSPRSGSESGDGGGPRAPPPRTPPPRALPPPPATTQRLEIWRPPRVLLVQLKRFAIVGPTRRKLTTPVSVPPLLDLAPFVSGPVARSGGGACEFVLYGLVHHYGSLTGGHYEAALRTGSSWAAVDDEDVRALEGGAEEACRPASSYLALYVRCDIHEAWVSALREGGGAPLAALRAVWPEGPPLASAAERAALERAVRCDDGAAADTNDADAGAAASLLGGGCRTQ